MSCCLLTLFGEKTKKKRNLIPSKKRHIKESGPETVFYPTKFLGRLIDKQELYTSPTFAAIMHACYETKVLSRADNIRTTKRRFEIKDHIEKAKCESVRLQN